MLISKSPVTKPTFMSSFTNPFRALPSIQGATRPASHDSVHFSGKPSDMDIAQDKAEVLGQWLADKDLLDDHVGLVDITAFNGQWMIHITFNNQHGKATVLNALAQDNKLNYIGPFENPDNQNLCEQYDFEGIPVIME